MFDKLNKHRVWIMCLLLVGLFGWGAWSAVQSLFGGNEIPNPEIGRFRVPGESQDFVVTAMDHSMTGRNLDNYFARMGGIRGAAQFLGIQDTSPTDTVYSYIAMREAARKSGAPVNPVDVENFYRSQNGIPPERKFQMPDDARGFLTDFFRTMAFAGEVNSEKVGPLYKDAFERFKSEQEEFRGRVALFEPKPHTEFAINLEDPAEMNKLVAWFDSNKWRFSDKKVKEQVDLEVIYVRQSGMNVAEFATKCEPWKETLAGFPVTDEEAQARWNNHRESYTGLLKLEADALKKAQDEENARAKEENREPKNLSPADQPSEFERLKDHLKREMAAGKLLAKIIDDIGAGAVMKDLASKYSLPIALIEKIDREKLQTQPEVGNVRAMQMIWGSAVQKLPPAGTFKLGSVVTYESTNAAQFLPKIFDEPGQFLAIYRLLDHRKERDSELREIRDVVVERWQKAQAGEELTARMKKFREDASLKVQTGVAEVKAKAETAKSERDQAVAKKLEELKLSRDNAEHKDQITGIESQEDFLMKQKVREAEAAHIGAGVAELCAEQNIPIVPVPWLKKSQTGAQIAYPDTLTPEERRNRFMRSSAVIYQLAALKPGQANEPIGADSLSGPGAIVILDEKRGPAPADFVAWPAKMKELAAIPAPRGPRASPFSFNNLTNAGWFGLSAPALMARKAYQEEETKVRAAEDTRIQREDARKNFAEVLRLVEEKRLAEAQKPPAPENTPAPTPAPPPTEQGR